MVGGWFLVFVEDVVEARAYCICTVFDRLVFCVRRVRDGIKVAIKNCFYVRQGLQLHPPQIQETNRPPWDSTSSTESKPRSS